MPGTVKVSGLPSDSAPTLDDILPTVDSGSSTTKKVLLSDLLTLMFNNTPSTTKGGQGYLGLGYNPNSISPNGNRSYNLTFNGVDLTGVISPGTKMRLTRNSAAPTQTTSLNGSTQGWSKSTPSGLSYTDDFTAGAWVKMAAYPTTGNIFGIISRYNATSGWYLRVNASGQVGLYGFNAGGSNYSGVYSYQSVPLNKWVWVAAELDMSAFTVTSTTSYVMFDGVNVPAALDRGGTNPTALIQAGNLEVGTANAASFFSGKIAQAFVFNAKVTQSTLQGYLSQTLTGSETSLVSAYSFNGTANDLNTGTANNLSAVGSATATTADSPFAQGAAAGTLEYAKVTSAVFSTNTTLTVQVAEGSALPTTGTISSTDISPVGNPYGFPAQRGKWTVKTIIRSAELVGIGGSGSWGSPSVNALAIPIGEWKYGFEGAFYQQSTAAGTRDSMLALASTTPTTVASPTPSLRPYSAASATIAMVSGRVDEDVSLVAATTYRFYLYLNLATGTETWTINGSQVECVIFAELAY